MSTRPIIIANCSGYSGDRRSALREALDGGPVDVIVGDYLAEITLAGMAARRVRGRGEGYSTELLEQLTGCLDELVERGVKLVVNAGGFDPAGLAERLRELHSGARPLRVAHLEGDDLTGRLDDLQARGHELPSMDTGRPFSSWGHDALSANAYLGAWGIADALAGGADVVICPRVTDASLVAGPAAWWHDWATEDWDRLAGAIVAGHVIECGPQACGGNFSGFTHVPGMVHPGFPIAEIEADGTAVITKHPGTGGAVTTDTVSAQLLYEIQGPIYLNPDVTVDLRDVELTTVGADRVRVAGARGTPPPATTKVAITAIIGWENAFSGYLCGLDIDAKAALVEAQARDVLAGSPVELARVDRIGSAEEDPSSIEAATVGLRFVGRAATADPLKPGAFFHRVHGTILSSIPGFHADGSSGRATRPSPLIEYWPALVPVAELEPVVVHDGGERMPVRTVPTATPPVVADDEGPAADAADPGPLTRVPLGALVHARAGDKGGNSNLGFWTGPEAWEWLRGFLTADRLRELYPEAAGLLLTRHELPHLRAVHFVVHGNLGTGCSSNGRLDALGKSVAEYVRARHVDAPEALIGSHLRGAEVAGPAI
ncbi:acyclic terpene utilization AtuA family protein [Patulibacter minatonensis]|uniref:acyclic terpene utilization AtuA family protein n=1 Tax=Patulibacter minatonensis TaxID=298163 RepID=UPI00047A2851|nr:acyclic terpene utilization AtuA family protein [Patulibacter minatonensis]